MNFGATYEEVHKLALSCFNKYHQPFTNIDTIITHAGYDADDAAEFGRPVIPPITLSTTFKQLTPGIAKYDYSRAGNFSRESLEKCIATLEDGDQCVLYGSGLAALAAAVQLLSHGDHIIAFDDLYGGSGRYLRKLAVNAGISHTMVDLRSSQKFEESLLPNTRLVIIETPSNPLMRLVDIANITKIAHSFNNNILVLVDNTFMTSYFQRPLDQGADIVLHSLTKYMNGHSDVVMGALITRSRPEIAEKLKFIQFAAGAVPSPFDCFLALRGIRTLHLRMQKHMLNGILVAMMLERHPLVEKVIHPGLKSFDNTDVIKKQMRGFSGMVSVYVRGNSDQTNLFVKSLKIFMLAESLGGFESLIDVPSTMTHASVPVESRKMLGITDNMVRLSVGLEDPLDLVKDLYQALDRMNEDI